MTVIQPNSVAGINSITVQNGNSLSIHKSDGSLLRTITGATGVTTFATASVGAAWTDFSQGGGLNIGLGASISNGSGNVLTFGTNGDDRVRIDSSGDVLIGRTSTSTSHTLCVQADNVAEAIAVIGRSADDISEIGFFENDTTTRLGELQYRRDHINFRHRVGDIRFCTAGTTERLRIDSSGKLLIAQTASYNVFAHSKLQISGTDSLAAASFTRWSANAYGPYINLGKSRGGVGAYTVVQDDDHLGTINFAAADGTDLESVGAAISAEVDGTPGGNDIPGRLVFKTTADGAASATERMRIHQNGAVSIANTRNYYGALNVEKTTASSTAIDIKAVGSGAYANAITIGDHNTIQGEWAVKNNSDIAFGVESNHAQTFHTNNTERLRITAGGQTLVGITTTGTTTNNLGLEVSGNNMIKAGSHYMGKVSGTGNNGSGTLVLHRLGQNVGFQMSGVITVHSYTGSAYLSGCITARYNNDAVDRDVTLQKANDGMNFQLVSGTISGQSGTYLGIKKNGGGTGQFYIHGFFAGTIESNGGIREVASGDWTTTTVHGSGIT